MIKVRFGPSPTGYLHIGGARTALFNWMYARAQQGAFVLRIEDTDRERSKQEYLEEILESLKWLGFEWDELYKQSDRFDIYREYAKKLVSGGQAYLDGQAVILKMPKQEIKLYDMIRGEIVFDTATLKDEVLMKSDGSPTYGFACVVDDSLMEISHVIRGEDHIPNTPKQMMIYQALGFKLPKFAHMPLIMSEDGSRMSKRTGAVAVSDYKKQGFLPEALVNYLMLLGWSPGNNQEIVPMQAAVKKFSLKKINKAAAAFSMDKLKWINAQYVKESDPETLVHALIPFLKEKGYIGDNYDGKHLLCIVKLYQSRMATFDEFLARTDYLFLDRFSVDEAAKKEHLAVSRKKEFGLLSDKLRGIEDFNASTAEQAFRATLEEVGQEASELVHPVRVALTGKAVGIGLFDTMSLLGKEKTIQRLCATFHQ